jgi:hypothetical protein
MVVAKGRETILRTGRSASQAALQPVRGARNLASEKPKPVAAGAGGTVAGGLVVAAVLVRRRRRRRTRKKLKRLLRQ